jgi:hypothetical protein
MSNQYSPQVPQTHERKSSVRDPDILHSGGTTNDMYSPLPEYKYSRKMDGVGDDRMQARGSDSNARDIYCE